VKLLPDPAAADAAAVGSNEQKAKAVRLKLQRQCDALGAADAQAWPGFFAIAAKHFQCSR